MRPNWFVAFPALLPALALEAPPTRVRLFAPEDRHLTLAFLGGCGEEAARAAWEASAAVASGPIDATLGATRPLGNPRRPSALTALLDRGHDALAALLAAHAGPVREAAGLAPERRDPLPHVTLARIQRKASGAQREEALRWAAALDVAGAPLRVDRLALYTWAADRKARLFRLVAERPL